MFWIGVLILFLFISFIEIFLFLGFLFYYSFLFRFPCEVYSTVRTLELSGEAIPMSKPLTRGVGFLWWCHMRGWFRDRYVQYLVA